MKWIIIITVFFFSCKSAQDSSSSIQKSDLKTDSSVVFDGKEVIKKDSDWKSILSPEQFVILREKGTERPYTSDLLDNKKKGVYHCAACDLPLFFSDSKFNSGCGWPSYFEPVNSKNVKQLEDRSHGMVRTEIQCSRCGGHLGHVFDDGPAPTGLRYCINGVALKFKEDK
jgi:peptide-methionine (R)-S-oxide reductase